MDHIDWDNFVFFGAGITNQEMDVEFKKLYDRLLEYKNNIFHLVDIICIDCDAGGRLAMNIAEKDSILLQRLVAKECDRRRMVRKAEKEAVLEQLKKEGTQDVSVQQILQTRAALLKDAAKTD